MKRSVWIQMSNLVEIDFAAKINPIFNGQFLAFWNSKSAKNSISVTKTN